MSRKQSLPLDGIIGLLLGAFELCKREVRIRDLDDQTAKVRIGRSSRPVLAE